ncbi:hypothetical protein [Negadavirga shengliensis]|uniref:Uncharacterized protein n=1 Tax=Negadavirga shengliensis TaxID=1389218 RepID=A0ABV9T1J7_9BACT
MKRWFWFLGLVLMMASCTLFRPRIPYQMGMSENRFLRQNRDAVISQLDGSKKVYRVNTDERFYILATFEEGVLTNLEERELMPAWHQRRMMEENNRDNP